MKAQDYSISKDKFVFAQVEEEMHDKELETKPISYFKDAFNRFKRNKASIAAAIIIMILVLFSIIGPFCTPYKVSYSDSVYARALPKNSWFEKTNFWDGCQEWTTNEEQFYYFYSMGVETGHNALKNQKYEKISTLNNKGEKIVMYKFRLDSYQQQGVVFMNLTKEQYLSIQEYQDANNVQIIYPYTDKSKRPTASQDIRNANYWFKTQTVGGKSKAVLNAKGELTNIYRANSGVNPKTGQRWDGYYSKMRVEGETPKYDYAFENQTGYEVRVNYYEYYIYYNKAVLKDGITKPSFLFGATGTGQDIFVCLSSGARFSFILAITVAIVNLFVGAIYGAIEGYYGGKLDLMMERFVEILSAVPFMIVITLLKYHMQGSSQVLILFIAFFLTGWIGMAGRTRMQFYRFKNQEYVLAARTLGASDKRIMFKHIFPNALGTLITSCVLVIPGMIFSETSLSYLGIINLNSGNMTSVGTLLANAQSDLASFPHIMLFPAVFICLLMLSFNLFGNGLRDAFNPSLRGSED